MLIDDDSSISDLVELILITKGFNVRLHPNGSNVQEVVTSYNPDLILLDIMLPRMDGYNICQVIRKNMAYRDLPIIMLSGKDGLFDKMRGKLAGSTEYMTKPFDSVELAQTVKRYLDSPAARERAARREMQMHGRLRRQM